MNVVIYTRDMEPITIIDLPMWALEAGERRMFVSLGIVDEVKLANARDPVDVTARTITLEFTLIRLGDVRSWLITTRDDELALLLRPSWLPGQRRKINEYERNNRRLASMLLDVLARGVGGH